MSSNAGGLILWHPGVGDVGPHPMDVRVTDEHTHPNLAGAVLDAELVIAGLKLIKADGLTAFLTEKAKAIAPADLSKAAPLPAAAK